MARTDFRAAAARRLSEERELSPAIVSLLSSDGPTRSVGVRIVRVDRIEPNPEQPRLAFDEAPRTSWRRRSASTASSSRSWSGRSTANRYQLDRRRAPLARVAAAGLATIPALVEEIDDDTALEISIIENLQREDLSPLDEAAMYDRMVREHGYSVRKLAQKLGKDKGYLENRLRLADAPPEVRELVSLRKDTLSHAYELMKVEDPKKRKRLAAQVARGELTLIKLRDKIEGRRAAPGRRTSSAQATSDGGRDHEGDAVADGSPTEATAGRRTAAAVARPSSPTTRWSTPSSSSPRRSRSSSTCCAARTSSARSRRRTGRTWPST